MNSTLNDKESYDYARQQAEPRAAQVLINDPTLYFDGAKILYVDQTKPEIDKTMHCDLQAFLSDGRYLNIDAKAATLKNRRGSQTNYGIDKSSIDYIRDITNINRKQSYWYMFEMYDDNKNPTGEFALVQAQKLIDFIDASNIQPKQGKKLYYLITPNIVKSTKSTVVSPDIPF